MATILIIDTALESASICLCVDGKPIATSNNPDQKEQATWIHVAIKKLFEETQCSINTLSAVSVTIGPGSYTGLRIGLATAKGICYATDKPLITCNTLFYMAQAALHLDTALLCPMIDARRMEVFTAVYKKDDLTEIVAPTALILNDDTINMLSKSEPLTVFGSGSNKFEPFCKEGNCKIADVKANASHLCKYSNDSFLSGRFTDVATAEPYYLKEFYTRAG